MLSDSCTVRYFRTFEEREEAFRGRVFNLVPRRYAGASHFWSDFVSMPENLKAFLGDSGGPLAYITANPQDCLAFGSASQVIRASMLTAKASHKDVGIEYLHICRMFGIAECVDQPIRTLSGGEAVKVALAKTYILGACSKGLTISSPFNWLAKENFRLLDYTVGKYGESRDGVEILALEGEDVDVPFEHVYLSEDKEYRSILFSIKLDEVSVGLQGPIGIDLTQRQYATFYDCEHKLESPCLLKGGNGQGKSLLAYVLSRTINFSGYAFIIRNGTMGPSRLLFQDVLTQKLHRSLKRIVSSCRPSKDLEPDKIYRSILEEFTQLMSSCGQELPLIGHKNGMGEGSLLETKFMLAAARICSLPSGLIIDEPDWGLSRESAICFVVAVSRIAHERGIPLIIISHKPWWANIVRSTIEVRKKILPHAGFHISLTKV